MENLKLQVHEDGGLRKVQNSRLVAIEKAASLGIAIVFGHRISMMQLSDDEVATLIKYLLDQYPDILKLPEQPSGGDLEKLLNDKGELLNDALDRMKELHSVIRKMVEAIEAMERLGEAQSKPPATMVDKVKKQMERALALGKEVIEYGPNGEYNGE